MPNDTKNYSHTSTDGENLQVYHDDDDEDDDDFDEDDA